MTNLAVLLALIAGLCSCTSDNTGPTTTPSLTSANVGPTFDVRPESIKFPAGPLRPGEDAIVSGPVCGETVRVTIVSANQVLLADSDYLDLDDKWEFVLPIPLKAEPGEATIIVSCDIADRNSVKLRQSIQITDN